MVPAVDTGMSARPAASGRVAVIFDLDGTLVQTESLKAESYAEAAAELNAAVDPVNVIKAYDACIGRSRDEVVRTLLDRFQLRGAAAARAPALGVRTPEEAFLTLRLRRYEAMLADPTLIRHQELPAATGLLRQLRVEGYMTALTTVSHAAQALLVLDALAIRNAFDVIVTIDDVKHGKPDPELYIAALARLHVASNQALAIEDSVPGVQAALAAGVVCVASANDLTRASIDAMPHDARVHVVDDPHQLAAVVHSLLTVHEDTSACN